MPASGVAVVTGGVLSMVKGADLAFSTLPRLSVEKNRRVVVWVTWMGPVYSGEPAVGAEPSVVTRVSAQPEPAPSLQVRVTEALVPKVPPFGDAVVTGARA